MADSTYIAQMIVPEDAAREAVRHSLLVRVTHWVFTLSFIGLVISGVGILLAHPRFYWGETGGPGTPSLFDLPLPTMLGGPSGWGRYMHFQSAWLAVLTGLLYVISGVMTRHFQSKMLPERAELSLHSLRTHLRDHLRLKPAANFGSYNVLQRIAYLAVIFALFPLMILTGFAMSPVITSVFPWTVEIFGGHQTARTIHFFTANLLMLFVVVHVAMVCVSGFTRHVGAMITGRIRSEGDKR